MNYEQRLRAVGRLIDSTSLRGVCIVEHDHGVLVVGLVSVTIADEDVIQPTSIEFDEASIERVTLSLERYASPLGVDGNPSSTPGQNRTDMETA